MLYGLEGHGRLARSVHPNAKCEGCLHFEANKGMTGLCDVGLQPSTCGEGGFPLEAYAPFAPSVPESMVERLGERHFLVVKAIVERLQGALRYGCPLHSQNASILGGTCTCGGVAKSLVRDAFWRELSNRVRVVTSREDADEFVAKAMQQIHASPNAAKTPPKTYLPGVHNPNSPVRKPLGAAKPKKPAATPPAGITPAPKMQAMKSDVTEGLLEMEELGDFLRGQGLDIDPPSEDAGFVKAWIPENVSKHPAGSKEAVKAARDHVAGMSHLSAKDHLSKMEGHGHAALALYGLKKQTSETQETALHHTTLQGEHLNAAHRFGPIKHNNATNRRE